MRPIIIGAGRGSRLGAETESIPKTLVKVMGRPMLEWILEALEHAGFQRKDVVFISGYAGDVVRARYPEFTFVQNENWQHNNILASLLCARVYLAGGFLSTYSDIVYDGAIAEAVRASPHAMALGCDSAWRRRYKDRTLHPESDAEKLRAAGSRVLEVSRTIASETAQGEFIGVMRLDAEAAAAFTAHFDRRKAEFAGRVWREGRTFEKAYLLDQLEDMLETGSVMHRVDTNGAYMEIDTEQDLSFAKKWWDERPSA